MREVCMQFESCGGRKHKLTRDNLVLEMKWNYEPRHYMGGADYVYQKYYYAIVDGEKYDITEDEFIRLSRT